MNQKLAELLDPHSCERVIGTYLYPHVVFGKINHNDPYSATKIVKSINVKSKEILLSQNGGLFVKTPPDFQDPIKDDSEPEEDDFWDKVEFEQKVAKAFDQIICELAFNSRVVSEPAFPAYISRGQLKDGHALISGGGGFQVPQDRVMKPSLELLSKQVGWDFGNQRENIGVLDDVANQEITSQLIQISENLPTVIASAYSAIPRRQPTTAIINSWVAVEQILNKLWEDFIDDVQGSKSKDILKSLRSASIKTEMLHQSGVIELELCNILHTARRNRNDVAHKTEIEPEMIKENIIALRDMIEFYCGKSVNIPQLGTSINW